MEQRKNSLLTSIFFVAIIAMFCCALWGSVAPVNLVAALVLICTGITLLNYCKGKN